VIVNGVRPCSANSTTPHVRSASRLPLRPESTLSDSCARGPRVPADADASYLRSVSFATMSTWRGTGAVTKMNRSRQSKNGNLGAVTARMLCGVGFDLP
jgi:hypothetical protein